MKRAILTGGTGFVGANLARRLLHDGHELHLFARQGCTPWRIEAIRADLHLHTVDLSDPAGLRAEVARVCPDWVFHLAVYGAYSSQTDLHQMVETNITGTANLIDACLHAGFEAFVNTGSSSEYGFKDHAPPETARLDPNSHYAVTKAAATHLCRHSARQHGQHMPTLRLYSVYGPYEEPTRLVPTLIAQGRRGALPPLVNPDIARDYVYTEDVSEAYVRAAEQPGQEPGAIYNVGTGIQTTLREVVEVARRVLGVGAEPVWGSMPARQWDSDTWVADNTKIKAALGWEPRYSFEQGFARVVEWTAAQSQ